MALFRMQALLFKTETTYGVDAVPLPATDAVLVEDVEVMPMEGTDLERGHERPFLGARPKQPVGLHAKIKFKVECKGRSATAGSIPFFGPMLECCAMAEVRVISTSVTYNPISVNHKSGTIYFYLDNVLYKMLGCRGTVTYSYTTQGIPYLEFEFMGMFVQPVTGTLPVATYGTQLTFSPVPGNSVNTPVFTIGGVSLILRSLKLSAGNEVKPRLLTRSESIMITAKSEMLDMVIEAPTLGTWNPYSLSDDASTLRPVVLTHGTQVGRTHTVSVPAAQILRPTGVNQQDGIVEWPIKAVPLPVAANDQFTLAFT